MTEAWTPDYEPWRHGGHYVMNVRYPNGGVGCVSRNYADRKWRIVCGDDEQHAITYATRDAAARAEKAIADRLLADLVAAGDYGPCPDCARPVQFSEQHYCPPVGEYRTVAP